jgi:peptidoglycan L-alanyl-D-glutamate endopeptidase CwlK
MAYKLGQKSLDELVGVHPDLVKVVKRAIELSTVDFAVHEGLRTLATQQSYVKRGVSKTLASKHLKQPDGYGHAVDLVPYVGGKLRWEWPVIYPIAVAMRQASDELNVPLRWGGVWDRKLDDLTTDMKKEVASYCVRHPGSDFIDGPHFEMRK